MKVRIQKLNPDGEVKYEYGGTLLEKDEHQIVVEAFFDRDDMPFQDVVFKKGDHFLEFYYFDRWYNIFEIYDRDNNELKGWYCNVGKPVVMDGDIVSYVDLALDLWVSAIGDQVVLDEDEFKDLELNDDMRIGALNGLKELRLLFATKKSPR
jgi:uncharacterized protein